MRTGTVAFLLSCVGLAFAQENSLLAVQTAFYNASVSHVNQKCLNPDYLDFASLDPPGPGVQFQPLSLIGRGVSYGDRCTGTNVEEERYCYPAP